MEHDARGQAGRAPWQFGAGQGAAPGVNALRGTVQRASFLGDSVDYQVQVADSDVVLRVAAPAGLRRRAGEAVGLSIDPAACIPLAATEERR